MSNNHPLTGSLTGGVVALAVLLLISVTINLLSAAYWIYRLRVRGMKSDGGGSPGNQEGLYEDVDGSLQPRGGEVSLKRNEAYGKIGLQNPSSNTTL